MLQKLLKLLRSRGIVGALQSLPSYWADYLFDLQYKTDTLASVDLNAMGIEEEKMKHAVKYQPTRAVPLRKLLSTLSIPPGQVLVDLGCGKGRVLLVASEFGFREVRGVEFSPLLCAVAEKNCTTFKERTRVAARFTIVRCDVREYAVLDDETVFFLFNPFDEYVLEPLLKRIVASLQRRPRPIWIIYREAVYRDLVAQVVPPARVMEFALWGQLEFVIFELDGSGLPGSTTVRGY